MADEIRSISNHIVILGWSKRVARIIAELRDSDNFSPSEMKPIIVVALDEGAVQHCDFERVYFLYGLSHDPAVLTRARVESAEVVLIPVVGVEAEAADGQNIFSLLAVASVNSRVRVCLEVASAASGEALEEIKRKKVIRNPIEIVSFEAVSEQLLAQCAINSGVTELYSELLSFGFGNEIYVYEVSEDWTGRSYREMAFDTFEREVLLIGYGNDEGLRLNPKDRGYVFKSGDRVWFIGNDREAVGRALRGSNR